MGQDSRRICPASVTRQAGTVEAQTEQGWQGRHRCRFEETLGRKEGGNVEAETGRHKVGRRQKGDREGGITEGSEIGCAAKKAAAKTASVPARTGSVVAAQ